jgi:ribosomal protein RSM22 (predicted rRNA methylase)
LGSTVKSSQLSSLAAQRNNKNQHKWSKARRTLASAPDVDVLAATRKAEIYTLIDNIHQHEDELAAVLDNVFLGEYDHVVEIRSWDLEDIFSGSIGHRNYQSLEAKVRAARQQFGEFLPDDHLNPVELELYNTLYGEAISPEEEVEEVEELKVPDIILRDDGQGGIEEIEVEQEVEVGEMDEESAHLVDAESEENTMERAQEVADRLGGVLMENEIEDEDDYVSGPRIHPLTEAGKFSTNPSTVFLPKDTVTNPIATILSDYPNKHITEAAHRIFGGPRMPHSTVTAPPNMKLPQIPIPLSVNQHHMTEMEANTYLAVLYPGIYASALSVLVEVRKRLGSKWLRDLINQETGPRVLDAGGGGAGMLAWRDILRAEYETMVPDHPRDAPISTGKSTVLAGSNSLQTRASAMLENTTFLPRLPDYVHIRGGSTLNDERAPSRKMFDVIIAPHTLLEIKEDYRRKQHVQNLWALLNPNGGVLIMLEKGRQRGFEAIAGAREMLLEKHIASPGATEYDALTESGDMGSVKKEPGMIIAPCTNHGKCPMYIVPGQSQGRSDYCHFSQRYIRPDFLQRIFGSKHRNHEDVEFSYVAIQRGVDMRETQGITQGKAETDTAFEGYEEDAPAENDARVTTTTPTEPLTDPNFNVLSLPRMIFSPMKRRGHVILDVCTPESKIERWTVPRSFSRQSYHDARKARWGDLWALGAKTRIPRHLKLGTVETQLSKKERMQSKAASKLSRLEEEGDEDDEGEGEIEPREKQANPGLVDALSEQADSLEQRRKGRTVPSWKRYANKKRIRQASKKTTDEETGDLN